MAEITKNQAAERDFLFPPRVAKMDHPVGLELGTGIVQKCFPVSLHFINLMLATPLILDEAAGTVSRQSPRGLTGVRPCPVV